MAAEGDHQLVVGDVIVEQDVLFIQDLEGWLQIHGLRGPDDDQPDQGKGDVVRARQRLEEEASYERQVHEISFGDALREAEHTQQIRRDFLDSIQGLQIDLITADGTLAGISLRKLAEKCDTIYTLAGTWENFSNDKHNIQFSLDGYSKDTVQEFVAVLLDDSKSARDISADAIVDCCFLAHYLCADQFLNDITDVLLESIDTSNCLTLCQLGDRLNLPLLFERSLAHLMDTIGDLERSETWDDFTPELRDRIATIKSAIESSVNSQSRLYFGSLDEYIAIFAERVQYFQERLAEAKEQHQETSTGTPAWYDTKTKIDRQERRVRTLEIALQEQKKLFTVKRSRMD